MNTLTTLVLIMMVLHRLLQEVVESAYGEYVEHEDGASLVHAA
jgi:hypothetical protein